MTARMNIRPLGNMGNQMLQYMFALSVRDQAGKLEIFGHDLPLWNIKAPAPTDFSSKPLILRGQHYIDATKVANLIRAGKIRDCEMRGLGFQMSNWTPLKTSPFCLFSDSIGLCDLQGADDAWTAWVLGFGRTLRASECRR